MITAKNINVRFHGPKLLYASSYSDSVLKQFAKKHLGSVKNKATKYGYTLIMIFTATPLEMQNVYGICKIKNPAWAGLLKVFSKVIFFVFVHIVININHKIVFINVVFIKIFF